MKKVSSKILAILLSFVVVLSMMPGMAFGDNSMSTFCIQQNMLNDVVCVDSQGTNMYILEAADVIESVTFSGFDNSEENDEEYAVYSYNGNTRIKIDSEVSSIDDFYLTKEAYDVFLGEAEWAGNNSYSDIIKDSDYYLFWIVDESDVSDPINYTVLVKSPKKDTSSELDSFVASAGSSNKLPQKKTGTYTYINYLNEDTIVDLYTVTIPAGTKEVNLKLSKASLVYNYRFNDTGKQVDDDYISGIVSDYTKGENEITVSVDANEDGVLDAIQIQNPYNADYSGGELRYAITFEYENFSASVNNKLLYDFTKVNDGYTSYGATVPLYKISVPEGTTTVDLAFNEMRLVYNYDASGKYLEGWVKDPTVGANNVTVTVDSNEDGISDIIQVQNPYRLEEGNYVGGELLYAILFETVDSDSETESGTVSGGINVPKVPINGVGSYTLQFYDPSGYECMLGNCWYSKKELKATLNETPDSMRSSYRYLSAYISVPEGKELSDFTVKWYYSDTYDIYGNGYTPVSIGEPASGTSGNLTYYNGKGYYENTFYFNTYPDTTKIGTYYYYVEISDGESTINSKASQAVVIVSPEGTTPGTAVGDIKAYFRMDGYGAFPGLSTTSKEISGGATAADIFKQVLDANGYTYEGLNKGYVSSVTSSTGVTLSEFDYGPNSGWMYRVNNEAPTVGMNSYVLSEGDTVIFYYVQDYTKDPYAIASMPSEDKAPTISITDKDGKDASSMGKVEYDASSNCVDISPASGYKVSDVKVNGVSKGAVTRLEGIKATDRIEVVFEAASAESETPAVSDQTAKIIAGVQAIKPKVTNTRLKSGIKVYWKKNSSYKVSYYQVYRKTGKNGTYKLIYTTKLPTTLKITNVKNLKKGKTYYYRVRGVRVIDGKKYYTKWSNYTYRKFR